MLNRLNGYSHTVGKLLQKKNVNGTRDAAGLGRGRFITGNHNFVLQHNK